MKKIGIIICSRYQDCGGGKCFRAIRERVGSFSGYPESESVEVVGYPPCPRIRQFKEYIESRYEIPVVIGTHPIPKKYFEEHNKLSFWNKTNMKEIAGNLMEEEVSIMESYN